MYYTGTTQQSHGEYSAELSWQLLVCACIIVRNSRFRLPARRMCVLT